MCVCLGYLEGSWLEAACLLGLVLMLDVIHSISGWGWGVGGNITPQSTSSTYRIRSTKTGTHKAERMEARRERVFYHLHAVHPAPTGEETIKESLRKNSSRCLCCLVLASFGWSRALLTLFPTWRGSTMEGRERTHLTRLCMNVLSVCRQI